VEAVALYAKTTITSRCLLHVGIANASFWPADLEKIVIFSAEAVIELTFATMPRK
jgi:hypothetical protein